MHTMQTETDKNQHVTLRMPASLVAELKLVARENDRSLSAEARLALRAWLEATKVAS